MHRQSLGSPSSKLHANGASIKNEDNSHFITSSPLEILNPLNNIDDNHDHDHDDYDYDDDDEEEKIKTHKLNSHKANAQKLVHLIPLFIFLCILVLFLFSHYPSQKELGEVDNFEEFPAAAAAATTMDLKNRERFQHLIKIGDGGILGIQSKRNLQGYKKVNLKYGLHRKIADFKPVFKQD